MLQHYFVDEQMFYSRGPLALLYRTFSKFKIERKWVIPLTHLLSVSEALSGFQVYMTSYEFPACLAEKFLHGTNCFCDDSNASWFIRSKSLPLWPDKLGKMLGLTGGCRRKCFGSLLFSSSHFFMHCGS